MDLKVVLTFVATHFHAIFGTTLALFFTTCMILLIRSIGEKQKGESEGGHATIDVKEIEGAMKRVLSTQPLSLVASSAPAGSGVVASGSGEGGGSGGADPAVVAGLETALRDKDVRIQTLDSEIEQLRAQLASAQGDNSGASAFADEIETLKNKNDELSARLAEYEIIEDDIADLSMFKEENARLKDEIAKLKAAAAAAPAPAPVAPKSLIADNETPLKFEKAEKFEIDPNDDIMKEFAAAVELERAPPTAASTEVAISPEVAALEMPAGDPQAAIDAMLAAAGGAAPAASSEDAAVSASEAALEELLKAPVSTSTEAMGDMQADIDKMFGNGSAEPAKAETAGDTSLEDLLSATPDPDKMLNEVETLSSAKDAEHEGDALEESLDTDKLLAEVDSLKSGAKAG